MLKTCAFHQLVMCGVGILTSVGSTSPGEHGNMAVRGFPKQFAHAACREAFLFFVKD
jgi:hypothetical protein